MKTLQLELLDLELLSEEELFNTDGGLLLLLVIGACVLLVGCSQENQQGGINNQQTNIQYNGSYPDTTIISHNGIRDTIINK